MSKKVLYIMGICLLILFLILVFFSGCAHEQPQIQQPPLRISILPSEPDWDKLLPAAPDKAEINPALPSFKDQPVISNTYCNKSTCLPSGILIDANNYSQIIADKSTLKRVNKELDLIKVLRNQEHTYIKQAENLYQTRIVELQEENKELHKPKFWDELKPYVAFTLGVGVTVLTTFSVKQVTK